MQLLPDIENSWPPHSGQQRYTLRNTSHGSGWHGPLEDYFPLYTSQGFSASMLISQSVDRFLPPSFGQTCIIRASGCSPFPIFPCYFDSIRSSWTPCVTGEGWEDEVKPLAEQVEGTKSTFPSSLPSRGESDVDIPNESVGLFPRTRRGPTETISRSPRTHPNMRLLKARRVQSVRGGY